jgi:hypothetical protein
VLLPAAFDGGSAPVHADVAQLVEQLIRNQQVVSSSLTVGSRTPRQSAILLPINGPLSG